MDKKDFGKILTAIEVLINDVEEAVSQDEIISERMKDIEEGKVSGKTENDYNEYLRKRGISN